MSKKQFTEMPWKNGKGKTLEIFRLPAENPNFFLFRLSMADVSSDEPFSIFPSIDRTLFLVSGNGMILNNSEKEIRLTEKWQAFHFAGEDQMSCRLIDGACKDFNVMIDRKYGKVKTSTLLTSDHQFKCVSDFTFIYDSQSESLSILEKGDHYHFLSPTQSTLVVCHLTHAV